MNLILKMLAVPATVLALWAANAQATPSAVEPAGKVCGQGQGCAADGGSATAVASVGGMNPDDVIANHCTACHSIGLLEAPKIDDTPAWKARADKEGGLDGLVAKAIAGLNAMPPKGTCGECSDADLKAAIQRMSGL